MLGYINQLRYEAYGSHDYDLRIDYDLLPYAQESAFEIVQNGYSAGVPDRCVGYQYSMMGINDYIQNLFGVFRRGTASYETMIDPNIRYLSYAAVRDGGLNVTAVLLFH